MVTVGIQGRDDSTQQALASYRAVCIILILNGKPLRLLA